MPELIYELPPIGGLKKDLPSQLLQRHFSPDLNAVWYLNGRIRRMPGLAKFASQLDASGVQGIYQFELDNGSDAIVGASRTTVYKIEATGKQYVTVGSGDRITVGPDNDYVTVGSGALGWTSIHDGTPFTGSLADFVDMISFFDSTGAEILIITNGVDATRKWTGSGTIAALGGTPPKAKYLEVFKNYLFHLYTVESGTTYPRRARYSALGNGESYPAEYFIDFKRTTDAIVGGKTLRDSLVIYKEKSISPVNYVGGALIFNLKENYIQGRSALSHRAIMRWSKGPELHYFISNDLEVYNFDLVTVTQLSSNIKEKLANLDPAFLKWISAVKSEEYDKILWAIPRRSLGGCYDLLVYDIKLGSWWIKEKYPVEISCMAIAKRGSTITWDTLPYASWDTFDVPGGWDAIGASEEESVLLIGNADGYVRNFAAGQDDDGTPVASHYTYPFDNCNLKDDQLKVLTGIYIETQNEGAGSVRLRVFIDDNDTDPQPLDDEGHTYKEVSLQPANGNRLFQVTQVDVYVVGYSFSVRIESDSYVWTGRIVKLEYEPIGKGIH